ncbi:MAG: hypothetical protein ACKV2O_05475 [Acidimicrobiales bacterium]
MTLLAGLLAGAVAVVRDGDHPRTVLTGMEAEAADTENPVAGAPAVGGDLRSPLVGPPPEPGAGSGAVTGVGAGSVRYVAHRACLVANGFNIELFAPAPALPGAPPPATPMAPIDHQRQLTAEERPVAEAATRACRTLEPGDGKRRRWLGCLDRQGLTVLELRGSVIPLAATLEQARPAAQACRPLLPGGAPTDARSQCLVDQGAWQLPLSEPVRQAAEATCGANDLLHLPADLHAQCLIENGLPGVGMDVEVSVEVARAAAPPCLHLGPGGFGEGNRCMTDRGIFTWLPVKVNWPEEELAAALAVCAQVDQAELDLEVEHARRVETHFRQCLDLAGFSYDTIYDQLETDPLALEAYTRCETSSPPKPPPKAWTAWEQCLANNGLAVPYDPAVIPLTSVRRALVACEALEGDALAAREARSYGH